MEKTPIFSKIRYAFYVDSTIENGNKCQPKQSVYINKSACTVLHLKFCRLATRVRVSEPEYRWMSIPNPTCPTNTCTEKRYRIHIINHSPIERTDKFALSIPGWIRYFLFQRSGPVVSCVMHILSLAIVLSRCEMQATVNTFSPVLNTTLLPNSYFLH